MTEDTNTSKDPNIAQPKASDSRGSEAKTVTQPSVSNGVTGAPNLGSAKPTQGSVLEGGLFNKGSTPLPGAGLFGSVTQTSTYEKPPTGGSFTFGNPSSTSTQPTTKSLFGANTFNQTSGQPPIFGTSAGSSSTKAPAQDTGRSLFNRGTSDSKK